MSVTLAALCQAIPGELQPVTPVPVPARAVSGVHVSELADPTPFLDGGELLLTTGLALPDQELPLDAYVARLAAHDVAGLALGLGPVLPVVPPGLTRACERVGLTLLVVPAHAPFQAVVREFWQQVGSGRVTDLQAAVGSAHALVRAALTDDPGGGVVSALGGAVEGWSALLDPHARVRHVHPRSATGRARQAAAEVARMRLSAPRSAATFPLGEDDVLVHGLDREGRLDGYLLIGRRRPLPPHARRLLVSACTLLQLHERWASPSGALPVAAPLVVGSLLRLGHAAAAADAADRLGVPVPTLVRLALVRDLPRAHLDRFAAETPCAPGGSEADPVLLVLDAAQAPRLWTELSTASDTAPLGAPAPTGATPPAEPSGPIAGVLTAAAPWAEAPSLLPRAEDALARTADGMWRDLAEESAQTGAAGADLVAESDLEALAAYPRADLVTTWAAYLRHRGRTDPAAAELGLHRNSMRHRMTLVRRILDVDVDDPDVASAWWLALRSRGLA
ncbi:PucR family transcriptional regulator [Mobilicoccus pelagius]|uniref:Putative transcriptional regulator n=1 Tax=Mobilicoccus pelagius NBRC 104925 TaxID=1089455 RepID=H5UU50_9MICO|nr:PucR family transcriptional regulator [Mobilicoccus pelagius]GAB49258.1 putative transcriptional regulator [Mobilicoccus pelagius NBRC 104925]